MLLKTIDYDFVVARRVPINAVAAGHVKDAMRRDAWLACTVTSVLLVVLIEAYALAEKGEWIVVPLFGAEILTPCCV